MVSHPLAQHSCTSAIGQLTLDAILSPNPETAHSTRCSSPRNRRSLNGFDQQQGAGGGFNLSSPVPYFLYLQSLISRIPEKVDIRGHNTLNAFIPSEWGSYQIRPNQALLDRNQWAEVPEKSTQQAGARIMFWVL